MYRWMMSSMGSFMELFVPVWCYISIVGIGVACYFVVNVLHIGKIKNIPIEQALKVTE